MLRNLVKATDRRRFSVQVISLTDVGPMGKEIQDLGFEVRGLGINSKWSSLLRVGALWRLLRELSPDVIQTWMYHADLLGGLVARMGGRIPVCWGIHSTNPLSALSPRTRCIVRLNAKLSSLVPSKIVCCSQASADVHVRFSFRKDRIVTIPNGFDVGLFKPSTADRASLRKELGITDTAILVGLVGRFSPEKDHGNFVRAAGILAREYDNLHFLLCGQDITEKNRLLAELIATAGIGKRTHLLGSRTDVARLNAAFDVAVNSSYLEALPMVVGEAMASGVPCVVTDVGDSALLVGNTGRVVPARDHEALGRAIGDLIQAGPDKRRELGEMARDRVTKSFSLESVARMYGSLYEEVAADRPSRRWFPGSTQHPDRRGQNEHQT
jgi:glycosyltransferase involved in cell wall biosynthesis